MREIPLYQLKPGERCVITGMQTYGPLRRRLRDLGFLPGSELVRLYSAPSGSPIAYSIKGSVIALRRSDCRQIMVKPLAE